MRTNNSPNLPRTSTRASILHKYDLIRRKKHQLYGKLKSNELNRKKENLIFHSTAISDLIHNERTNDGNIIQNPDIRSLNLMNQKPLTERNQLTRIKPNLCIDQKQPLLERKSVKPEKYLKQRPIIKLNQPIRSNQHQQLPMNYLHDSETIIQTNANNFSNQYEHLIDQENNQYEDTNVDVKKKKVEYIIDDPMTKTLQENQNDIHKLFKTFMEVQGNVNQRLTQNQENGNQILTTFKTGQDSVNQKLTELIDRQQNFQIQLLELIENTNKLIQTKSK